MITLKFWNSLDNNSRRRIASTFYFDDKYSAELCEGEWHHSFDYNTIGKRYKLMLSNCYLKDYGYIEIRLSCNYRLAKDK